MNAPLPPGVWNVKVYRGPDYVRSGFGDQDGGPMNYGWCVRPTKDTLKVWAKEWAEGNRQGGWSPYRSAEVVWNTQNIPYFYKANDNGEGADKSEAKGEEKESST